MRAFRSAISAVAIAFLGCINTLGQTPVTSAERPPESSLHAVHNALFASFLRVDELPNDPHTTALLKTARDAIWQQTCNLRGVQQLLEPFADLRRLGGACGIAQTVQDTGATSFAALSAGKRQQVLLLLQNCSEGAPRRLAATVRNLYIVKGYGAVQGELTGIKLDVFAPPEYLKSNMPHLAPTRLTYDGVKKELVERMATPSTC
jgi:hypothetical protein